MQKRIVNLYSFLFLVAFAAVLALTACSGDGDRSKSDPTADKSIINVKLELPATSAKTYAQTEQILMYLTQKNAQQNDVEVANSREIFTAGGDTPYYTDCKCGEYENHAATGAADRYVTFSYTTDQVDDESRYTVVLEYLGDSKDDVIAKAFHEQPEGFESGKSYNLTASSDSDDFDVTPTDNAVLVVNPTSISATVGDEPTAITSKLRWTNLHEEDVTLSSTYEVAPETLGTINKTADQVTFTAQNEGTGTITVTDRYGNEEDIDVTVTVPSPAIYTLIVDYSGVQGAAMPKDSITGVKFKSTDATLGPDYTAYVTDMSAGEYPLTFTDVDGNTYTTNHNVNFVAEPDKTEIKVALTNADFDLYYSLEVNYEGVDMALDKTKVTSIVSSKAGYFTVPETGYVAVSEERVPIDSGTLTTQLHFTADGIEYTSNDITFTANPDGVISVDIGDEDFPEVYTLIVDYSQIPESVIKKDQVTKVQFDITEATILDTTACTATLTGVKKESEEPDIYRSITLIGESLEKTTKDQVKFETEKAEVGRAILVTLPADTEFEGKNYELTLNFNGGWSSLYYGNDIADVVLNTDYHQTSLSKTSATFSAPLGTYTVTLVDTKGNTYTYNEQITFSRDDQNPGKSTQTVEVSNFDATALTLKLDFSNSDVKSLLRNVEPSKAVVKHGGVDTDFTEATNEWFAYYTFDTNPEEDWTDCEVTVVHTTLGNLTLKSKQSFNRTTAANNTITVAIDKGEFTCYPMIVKYGNGTIVPIINLGTVTSVTIDGISTTFNVPTNHMTITATTGGVVASEGQHQVVINSPTLKDLTLNINFYLKEVESQKCLVAELQENDFPSQYGVVEVLITGLGTDEKIYDVKSSTDVDHTLVNGTTYCWQERAVDGMEATGVKAYLNDKTVKNEALSGTSAGRHFTAEFNVSEGEACESVINVTIVTSRTLELIDAAAVKKVKAIVNDGTPVECTLKDGTWYVSTPAAGSVKLLVYYDDINAIDVKSNKAVSYTTPLIWEVKDNDVQMVKPVAINLYALKKDYTLTTIDCVYGGGQQLSKPVDQDTYVCDIQGGVKQMINSTMTIKGYNGSKQVVECTNANMFVNSSTQTIVVSKEEGWTIESKQ